MTPRWLTSSIVLVVATTAVLSVGWSAACTFYIGPRMFDAAMQGKLEHEPAVCEDAENRALQVLTALLATLIGLRSNPPE
jgi:hypothetical protein